MAFTVDLIRHALGTKTGLDPDNAKRVVEIACLATAADGNLAKEELEVIKVLCTDLAVDPGTIDDALLLAGRADRLDRLRVIGGAVSTDAARELAYRVTVLTSLADLASADEEFEFDLDVQDALQLDSAVADRIAREVNEAVAAAG